MVQNTNQVGSRTPGKGKISGRTGIYETVEAFPVKIKAYEKNGELVKAIVTIGWEDAAYLKIALKRDFQREYVLVVDVLAEGPQQYTVSEEDMYLVRELEQYLRSEHPTDLMDWVSGVIAYIRRRTE